MVLSVVVVSKNRILVALVTKEHEILGAVFY